MELTILICWVIELVAGIVYPVYGSLSLISKDKHAENQTNIHEMRQWGFYWCVYVFLNLVIQTLQSQYLVPDIIPTLIIYLKIIVILVLVPPRWKFSAVLITKFIDAPDKKEKFDAFKKKIRSTIRSKILTKGMQEKLKGTAAEKVDTNILGAVMGRGFTGKFQQKNE
jgi:hypothetical protein